MSERQANVILAFVFGVIFVTALLLFVLFVPNPTLSQFRSHPDRFRLGRE